ncbi:MAG: tRNA 2-thiouridine(34) synthase MnmA, partial [Anaerolineae bacterium]|nr:tRNA 2-thiouridine(34) synthase MnmA [Anaerolineae bacterium]
LSGGVDSSVALNLIKQSGNHEVTAFYLKIWLEDDLAFLGECPWEDDLAYARAVCEQAGVPLEIVPLQTKYFEKVVSHAISELKAGRTPSPDILCNQRIKFGEFFRAIDDSFDKVASGHYAQIEERAGQYWLKRAPDPVKDQTYFLSSLSQAQLSRALFPIGPYTKAEVRDLAHQFDLPTQSRKDSQGICFLGKIRYRDFVEAYLGEQPGDIVEIESGEVRGRHRGYWFYTIGQRKGLGLHGGPWFVVKKDVDENIIYISHKEHFEAQARNTFTVADVHWIAEPPDKADLQVKIRHSPHLEPCRIEAIGERQLRVTLADDEPGLAPGQSAIFYDDWICLGGGVIE